ncbi:MAG: hypothetical protein EP313_05625 [Bacteroidetes bacterium]|nr:MAG: hypothetical protein EP313_05625 [Bacteroidota bacterium]
MRVIVLLFLLVTGLVSSCNLEPAHSVYTNVLIPFSDRIVPEHGIVGQPVNISASAMAENGCWLNIRFVLIQKDDLEYEMVALADFESYGACTDMIVYGDTTVSFIPDRTGNHVITFWMTQVTSETDTVVVGPAPGK